MAGALAALVAGTHPAHGAVALDAVTQDSARPTDRIDITTLTVANAPDRLLLVGISIAGAVESATRITWAGTPLVPVTQKLINPTGTGCSIELWRLVAPTPGNNVLAISVSSAVQFGVGAVAYTGVDQTTPIADVTSAVGRDQAVAAPGDGSSRPIFASACVAGSWAGQVGVAPDATAGPGQVALWDFTEMNLLGLGSHRLDVASALRWDIRTADPFVWAAESLVLNPARPPADGGALDAAAPDAAVNVPAADAPAVDASPPADAPPPDDAAADEPMVDAVLETSPHAGPGADAEDDGPSAATPVPDVHLHVGCGCRTGSGRGSALWWLVLLAAITARSRGRR